MAIGKVVDEERVLAGRMEGWPGVFEEGGRSENIRVENLEWDAVCNEMGKEVIGV